MTQDTYRFAYEEAMAELRGIQSQYDQLCLRKERVAQVMEALKPLLMQLETAAPTAEVAVEPAPFLVQQSVESIPEPVAAAAPQAEAEPEPAFVESSDPFQRRIDNALRHGFGSRESRILPRALNGLLSRA